MPAPLDKRAVQQVIDDYLLDEDPTVLQIAARTRVSNGSAQRIVRGWEEGLEVDDLVLDGQRGTRHKGRRALDGAALAALCAIVDANQTA
jgi:hypothetical protein